MLNVFFLALNEGENYTLKPDGLSYIIYSVNKSSTTCHKPFQESIVLRPDTASKYYIVKCRPTYVSRLLENKVDFLKHYSPRNFLNLLESEAFRTICPNVLESILFHLHFKNGSESIETLQKRYQCSSAYIETGFLKFLGLSFRQYQNILLNTT